ncbi:MAG: type II toxin-antitoxin system RelE/ParE family toxin [Bacteroidales bacterium]|jgi:plasmid stabilization system protein ParE|nr:type II toxin-antitoxin system RelE/ParE family toxin [Bacteroidales bacterium]
MVVRWSDVAMERMENIFNYYLNNTGHNTAAKIVAKIHKSASALADMPFMAPVEESLQGRTFTYRSLTVSRIFKVVYFIDEKAECVVVATIHDCRRNPAKLQDEIPKHDAPDHSTALSVHT